MKKTRFYNVLFPLWFFLFLPYTPIFLITLVGNALIDSGVLYLGCRIHHQNFLSAWKTSFLKIYLFGYLSDFLGGIAIILFSSLSDSLSYAMMFNPFSNFRAFFLTSALTALAGFLIYVLNRNFSFKKLNWTKTEIHHTSLLLAVLTAPYLFLFPSILLYY